MQWGNSLYSFKKNKDRDITVYILFVDQQNALKPQIQLAPNLVDKHAYEFPTYQLKFSSIRHYLSA
jgi:hypothetical protein